MSSLVPTGGNPVRQARRDVQAGLTKLDGLAEFSAQAMEYMALLNARRKFLAQGDPALDAILMEMQLRFGADAMHQQATMYNRWR